MARKKLAICDREERYLFRLRDFLDNRETFPFDVCTYTDISILKSHIEKGIIELALIDETFVKEIEKKLENVIVLSTGKIKHSFKSIWKYQSGEAIRKNILSLYVGDETEAKDQDEGFMNLPIRNGGKPRVIGFFSPVHRALQSSLAIALGQILSQSQSCLYLNFEGFSGLQKLDTLEEPQKDITDLIYYIRAGKSKISYRFESMVSTVEQLDYILPAHNFCDLNGITSDDWLDLISEIKKMNLYENIILDLSEMVHGLPAVLKECDAIFGIRKMDHIGKAKIEGYLQTINEFGYNEISEKTIWLDVPIFNKFNPDIRKFRNTEMWMYVKDYVLTHL